jgi:hypothetical protein
MRELNGDEMLRLITAVTVLSLTVGAAHAGPSVVSDFAFAMPETWFVLPGPSREADAILFRRYSVAMRKTDYAATRSGRTNQIRLMGPAGQLYNSMIYTCRKSSDKPDYLTFHLPPQVSPASFKYDTNQPKLEINIVVDTEPNHAVVEYKKGDIFLDAADAGAGNLLRLMRASEITINFGSRNDRFTLGITAKFGSVELAKAMKDLLPQMASIDPGALRSFSNQELREHCLAYKGHL